MVPLANILTWAEIRNRFHYGWHCIHRCNAFAANACRTEHLAHRIRIWKIIRLYVWFDGVSSNKYYPSRKNRDSEFAVYHSIIQRHVSGSSSHYFPNRMWTQGHGYFFFPLHKSAVQNTNHYGCSGYYIPIIIQHQGCLAVNFRRCKNAVR